MMEIEFSVIEGHWDKAHDLLPLLQEFEKRNRIHVNMTAVPWSTAWAENVKHGIYGHGPDVSMIGASWVGSLASMQALRPFTPAQVDALGGKYLLRFNLADQPALGWANPPYAISHRLRFPIPCQGHFYANLSIFHVQMRSTE